MDMRSIISGIERTFKTLLPSPFTIAIALTIVTILLALLFGSDDVTLGSVLKSWEQGLWNTPLLAFAVQMMLMLVLGHALALTKPVDTFINFVTQYCTSNARAAGIVTLLTVLVALFNWGLGLIFGAILARKVGEFASRKSIALNYPLIGAAGYSGLMVWHGGISGSAPIKAAEEGHLKTLMSGYPSKGIELPDAILFSDTVFGTMNLQVMFALIIGLPLFMFWLGKRTTKVSTLPQIDGIRENKLDKDISGTERLDHSKVFSSAIGIFILTYVVYSAIEVYAMKGLGFINPNFINLLLLGLCLAIHKNIQGFLSAIDEAIGGASGILIQFPLYFGIMGIMKGSGLVGEMSAFFVSISNETLFPIYTFFSAGIVNVFVPSGGGQWGVQGPIIIQAASELGVSLPKAIMALSYGDQVTNMLQPFWALPLLGITGLKAKSILPYTVALMLIGSLIFMTFLLIS